VDFGAGKRKIGDRVTFVVPTGNFGDVLAGYYAKAMGLPSVPIHPSIHPSILSIKKTKKIRLRPKAFLLGKKGTKGAQERNWN
jgi:hypothetical protein